MKNDGMEDVALTKKDKEALGKLEHLSPVEALRVTGCEVREVKTPYGDIVIIESPLMKEFMGTRT